MKVIGHSELSFEFCKYNVVGVKIWVGDGPKVRCTRDVICFRGLMRL